MQFPFITENLFDYDAPFVVPTTMVGRLDLISQSLYGFIYFYKPLAIANGIVMPMGARSGIRKTSDSIRNELYLDGLRGNQLEIEYNMIMQNRLSTNNDWDLYSDVSSGMFSDVYEGRVLQVPTFQSANAWLLKYQYPENIDETIGV